MVGNGKRFFPVLAYEVQERFYASIRLRQALELGAHDLEEEPFFGRQRGRVMFSRVGDVGQAYRRVFVGGGIGCFSGRSVLEGGGGEEELESSLIGHC